MLKTCVQTVHNRVEKLVTTTQAYAQKVIHTQQPAHNYPSITTICAPVLTPFIHYAQAITAAVKVRFFTLSTGPIIRTTKDIKELLVIHIEQPVFVHSQSINRVGRR